jgi:hypothetical protein
MFQVIFVVAEAVPLAESVTDMRTVEELLFEAVVNHIRPTIHTRKKRQNQTDKMFLICRHFRPIHQIL